MATGTIKNQHKGTWTEVSANLKYQVRSGIVFVWAKGASNSPSSWAVVGTLPASVTPPQSIFLVTYVSSGASTFANYYIANDGKTYFYGNNANAPALFTYPLP